MTDGSLVAVPVARQIKKPFIICRDYHYDLPEADLVKFRQRTLYFSRLLYFARPQQGRRICIFDAIISSGQTVIAAGHALRKAGCEISGVVTELAKFDYGGVEPAWLRA
jgi:adenine/guanine phosphoribosyltransferase-like PRPP-binding protein